MENKNRKQNRIELLKFLCAALSVSYVLHSLPLLCTFFAIAVYKKLVGRLLVLWRELCLLNGQGLSCGLASSCR